jgi:hypothetical protein
VHGKSYGSEASELIKNLWGWGEYECTLAIPLFNHFSVLYTSEHDFADEFVATDGVEVHDDDLEGTVPDLLPGHLKLKCLKIRELTVCNAISVS